ncbi:MAG: hypothetical protein J6C58_03765 [Bacteroidaceae bacterium]|nr:hypothetical protein [Bacteroidaceae bacterium]
MMKNLTFVENGFLIMIWLFILVVLMVAFAFRVVACVRKCRQSGKEWNLTDKYAANEFGE